MSRLRTAVVNTLRSKPSAAVCALVLVAFGTHVFGNTDRYPPFGVVGLASLGLVPAPPSVEEVLFSDLPLPARLTPEQQQAVRDSLISVGQSLRTGQSLSLPAVPLPAGVSDETRASVQAALEEKANELSAKVRPTLSSRITAFFQQPTVVRVVNWVMAILGGLGLLAAFALRTEAIKHEPLDLI